ncbi:MAG TPA: cation diffusion facilitator family transporter [Candidatus Stackebrandtia faecavium]|nr:cation diffusion facilitator family transporter [Candidatus Stackebrandtia faecavium]
MGAGHDHGALSMGYAHRWRLWFALGLTTTVMIIQVVGGIATNSLSLISDAGHMGTDALGLGMALAAILAVANATRHPRRTFGLHRLEVLAALANTLLLLSVSTWVVYEAITHVSDPPQVKSTPMLIVAVVGLLANGVSLLLLRNGADDSINIRGAYLEVLGDLLGSVGVILAALIIATTGWWYADPIVAIAIGAFMVPRALKLGRDAMRILLQNAPQDLDMTAVNETLRETPGVADVHDLHAWTLTSGMDVVSAHLTVKSDTEVAGVLMRSQDALRDEYGITHATLQVEPGTAKQRCESLNW